MDFKLLFQKIRNREQNQLDNLILIIIILSAVLIGIETDEYLFTDYHVIFNIADIIILSIFIIEVIIKMIAYKNPWLYFTDPWNVFDFLIILLCLIPLLYSHNTDDSHALISLRVFRLARLFRAMRVLRVFRLITHLKSLELIVETLIKSIPSMMFVIMLLSILFYVYGIIGVFLFRVNDSAHFGDLGISLVTLFSVISGNWTGFMEDLASKGDIDKYLAPLYFISFYFLAGLIVLNLFIGIIVDQLSTVRIQKEIDELREGFQDDLTKEQSDIMIELENKIQDLNNTYKNLSIVLNKNQN